MTISTYPGRPAPPINQSITFKSQVSECVMPDCCLDCLTTPRQGHDACCSQSSEGVSRFAQWSLPRHAQQHLDTN